MIRIPNISISVPSSSNMDRYMSFNLKRELSNEPSEFKSSKKILAVSDIEGNFLAFRRLLLKYRIINKNYEWTFGDGRLVIVGDCFDRGDQVTECLWLIYMLEERAQREGGYVHFILGNHEIMNMNGDWRYVHPKYARFTKSNKPHIALYDGNRELWRWLCTKNIIEIIGDMLFVHGGIAEDLLQLNLTVQEINSKVRPFYTQANNVFDDLLLKTVFTTDHSPLWYRGYYRDELTEDLINRTLRHFDVRTIVTGHTVVDEIKTYYNGKIINLDTDHGAGNSEGLLIINKNFYRVDHKGKKQKIK